MKLFKYILVGWCLLTGMYSCEYVIDLEPENQVSFTNFFKTEQDISAVVNMFHINLRAAETRVIERDMLGWFADQGERAHGIYALHADYKSGSGVLCQLYRNNF